MDFKLNFKSLNIRRRIAKAIRIGLWEVVYRSPQCIAFRVVEEIDAIIVGQPHQLIGHRIFQLLVKSNPAAQSEHTQLKTAAAHSSVFHNFQVD